MKKAPPKKKVLPKKTPTQKAPKAPPVEVPVLVQVPEIPVPAPEPEPLQALVVEPTPLPVPVARPVFPKTLPIDHVTGLPKIVEVRVKKFWRAIPRKMEKLALAHDEADEGTLWYPRHHEWEGQTIQRVRCWKCGRNLKSWRTMLESRQVGFSKDGKPIAFSEANMVKVGGKPAVAFLPLPHATSTPIGVYLPVLGRKIVFAAQHCLDCTIEPADAENVLCCFLAGTDAILWNAWNHRSASTLTPDRWATYLYRWHNAEPIGRMTEEETNMAEFVPAPGELITSAHAMVNQDIALRAVIPSGAIVEYDRDEPPAGWIIHPTKPGRIMKI